MRSRGFNGVWPTLAGLAVLALGPVARGQCNGAGDCTESPNYTVYEANCGGSCGGSYSAVDLGAGS